MGRSRLGLRCTAMVLLGLGLTVGPAQAITFDHLMCLKVKDSASMWADLDLRPLATSPFQIEVGCTVKPRSRQLCVPVAKHVGDSSSPLQAVDGQDLSNAFLCYKLKCPRSSMPPSLEMSDQFATRTLSGFRTQTLCVPAIDGPPPPTTTTTLPTGTPRSCVDATPPNCDGTCNNYNLACAPDAGACICLYVDVFGGCPMFGGDVAAGCHGSCEGSQTCIEVSGACQCGFALE